MSDTFSTLGEFSNKMKKLNLYLYCPIGYSRLVLRRSDSQQQATAFSAAFLSPSSATLPNPLTNHRRSNSLELNGTANLPNESTNHQHSNSSMELNGTITSPNESINQQ